MEDQIQHLEQDYVHTKECIVVDGKVFELYETKKQTGYCAKHISSIIDGIKNQGREPLIVDLPRNRRLVFASLVV